jgi:hypothetical protein
VLPSQRRKNKREEREVVSAAHVSLRGLARALIETLFSKEDYDIFSLVHLPQSRSAGSGTTVGVIPLPPTTLRKGLLSQGE